MSGQKISSSDSDTARASGDLDSSDRDITIGDIVFDRDDDHSDPALVVNIPPKTAEEWTAYRDVTVAEDNPAYPATAPVIVISYWDEIDGKQSELGALDEPTPLRELHDADITHYTFPAPRLRRGDPATDDIEEIETIESSEDSDESSDSDGMGDGTPATPEDEDSETSVPDTDSADTTATATEQDATRTETESEAETEDKANEQELQQLTDYLLENDVRSEIEDGMVVVEKLGQHYEISLNGEVDGDGPYQDRLEQLISDYQV